MTHKKKSAGNIPGAGSVVWQMWDARTLCRWEAGLVQPQEGGTDSAKWKVCVAGLCSIPWMGALTVPSSVLRAPVSFCHWILLPYPSSLGMFVHLHLGRGILEWAEVPWRCQWPSPLNLAWITDTFENLKEAMGPISRRTCMGVRVAAWNTITADSTYPQESPGKNFCLRRILLTASPALLRALQALTTFHTCIPLCCCLFLELVMLPSDFFPLVLVLLLKVT